METVVAKRLFTLRAPAQASATARGAAAATCASAVAADRLLAALTQARFIARQGSSALVTGTTRPTIQGHMRAGRVIRLQDLVREHKKVEDPALGKRGLNRRCAAAFTEPLGIDM